MKNKHSLFFSVLTLTLVILLFSPTLAKANPNSTSDGGTGNDGHTATLKMAAEF